MSRVINGISFSFLDEPLFDDANNLKAPFEVKGSVIPRLRRTWSKAEFKGIVINVSDPGDEQDSIKDVI